MHKSINKITTIALTGGIACGKTEVGNLLADLGVSIIDLDILARTVVEPNSLGLNALVKVFGKDILQTNTSLNREKLKQLLFANTNNKKTIDDILHPFIIASMNEEINQLQQQGLTKVLIIVPLLVETNMQGLFDKIIVVNCTPEQQKQRLTQRDGLSIDYITSILSAQATHAQRLAIKPDYIINNIDNKEKLNQRVKDCYSIFFKN